MRGAAGRVDRRQFDEIARRVKILRQHGGFNRGVRGQREVERDLPVARAIKLFSIGGHAREVPFADGDQLIAQGCICGVNGILELEPPARVQPVLHVNQPLEERLRAEGSNR